jgi:RNA polymerase sigma-70 factor (ECF subfamily)
MATPENAAKVACAEVERTQPLDLDRLYRAHAAEVSGWIRRHWPALETDVVQDLLHEVFLVVQQRLGAFRFDSKVTTWLYGITVRVVLSRRRKERWRRVLWARVEPELELDFEPVETPTTRLEREHASASVYAVLDRLPERDRTMLILFELDGLPGPEIATILGLKPANVSVILHRARKRFEKEFVLLSKKSAQRRSGAR